MNRFRISHARIARVSLFFVLSLAACAPASTGGVQMVAPTRAPAVNTATPVPTPAPTVTPLPTATPEPRLAEGVYVAGVEVGGLTVTEARSILEQQFSPLLRPLDVRAGKQELLLRPEEIGFRIELDSMLDAARTAGIGERLPLQVTYDQEKLRAVLATFDARVAQAPRFSIITSTETLSRSFAIEGGLGLDLDDAMRQIDNRLRSVGAPRSVTLALTPLRGPAGRPEPAQLQEQLEEMVDSWRGVIGVYVYDLESDEVVADVHSGTAFAAASTIKLAIMLNAYINVPEFSEKQELALRKMIIESDNLAANALLAASVGGTGTEDAIIGAEQMSAMLAELGLKETFQYVPFEAQDYIKLMKLKIKAGPTRGGVPPYTDAGRYLRTTPGEMAQLYIEIDRCARGQGVLLETFGDTLTSERCIEMLDRLETNGDRKRMVAGVPEGVRVEHKSGWIPDMQADAGIVRSPGGDYVLAIYVYRPLASDDAPVPDRIMMSTIAAFSRLVYTYYNPLIAS
ncbi:MAG: serine hydrolase [Chloroflexi bacterium]|nr:serine hydrolase [Chloroflexota bacterium]